MMRRTTTTSTYITIVLLWCMISVPLVDSFLSCHDNQQPRPRRIIKQVLIVPAIFPNNFDASNGNCLPRLHQHNKNKDVGVGATASSSSSSSSCLFSYSSMLTSPTVCCTVTDDDLLVALQKLEELDNEEFEGNGYDATEERSFYHEIIEEWALQQEIVEDDYDDDENYDYDDFNYNYDNIIMDDKNYKYVTKHSSNERVAIFGGDPQRRRLSVEKKLKPYKLLDQYGTPKDVGEGDTTNLIRKINAGKYDVVYIWTKFNCHSSRSAIRDACSKPDSTTRFVEINSLAYILKYDENEMKLN